MHANNENVIFSDISDANLPVNLPSVLFTKWVTSAAPAIDLRGAQLSPAQWCTLTAAILKTPTTAVRSLHLEAGSHISLVALQMRRIKHAGLQNFKCPCSAFLGAKKRARDSCVTPEAKMLRFTGFCNVCKKLMTHTSDGAQCDVHDMHLQISSIMAQEHMQMLGAAQAVVTHISTLQTLGLHNLLLSPHMLIRFEEVLASLPASLTQLHLTTASAYGCTFGEHEKVQFFRAVAQVCSLRELHMKEWETFVGKDAYICTEPLLSIPKLKICVPAVKESAAFPCSLKFQALSPEML